MSFCSNRLKRPSLLSGAGAWAGAGAGGFLSSRGVSTTFRAGLNMGWDSRGFISEIRTHRLHLL